MHTGGKKRKGLVKERNMRQWHSFILRSFSEAYLGGRSQQRELCCADVNRERADIKPANPNKENTFRSAVEGGAAASKLQTAVY